MLNLAQLDLYIFWMCWLNSVTRFVSKMCLEKDYLAILLVLFLFGCDLLYLKFCQWCWPWIIKMGDFLEANCVGLVQYSWCVPIIFKNQLCSSVKFVSHWIELGGFRIVSSVFVGVSHVFVSSLFLLLMYVSL